MDSELNYCASGTVPSNLDASQWIHTLCISLNVALMQGVVGTMPWVALGFMTLYLQLLGFSDMAAALLVAMFSLGASLGNLGGGYIGALTPAVFLVPTLTTSCCCHLSPTES